ncbi:MAG: hypothetical protein JWP87_491 [Labilithrix sp.]|nr:hypothetical protein [Labilithrix sp.]
MKLEKEARDGVLRLELPTYARATLDGTPLSKAALAGGKPVIGERGVIIRTVDVTLPAGTHRVRVLAEGMNDSPLAGGPRRRARRPRARTVRLL